MANRIFHSRITLRQFQLLTLLLLMVMVENSHSSNKLIITSPAEVKIMAGNLYTESAPAYSITTNGASPWFEAYDLPPGFFINRVTGNIYGKSDFSGSYFVTIAVTSNFETISAVLSINVQATLERNLVVTNLSSDKKHEGSLPWAVDMGNQSIIPARITFNINGGPPFKIILAERLWINEKMIIDATTQPGYIDSPLVEVDANGAENVFTLVGPSTWHNGSSGSEIAGLHIYNFRTNAIATQPGANSVVIRDNYLGFRWDFDRNRWWRNFEATLTDEEIENYSGPIYNGYTQAVGIGIQSSDNVIEKNVISGVHNGISVGYDFHANLDGAVANWNNVIQYNRIGVTPDGQYILTNTSGAENYQPDTDANPFGAPSTWKFFGNNSDGIYLAALAKGTIISNNIASGNFSSGIELLHDSVELTEVYANYVGVNALGEKALPNGELGIILSNGAHDNLVGGMKGANIIAGNYYAGIELGGEKSFRSANYNTIQGNYIGCNATCSQAIGFQSVGIHVGTSDAHTNVIEGNVVVGNQWGIYIDGGNDNVISNNYVGTTSTNLVIGNANAGIVIDKGKWNKVLLNQVKNNGYGIAGHNDWFFGIWNIQSNESNSFYENIITSNRTETNTSNMKLPTNIFVYPTQSIFISCIDLDGLTYKGHLQKLGNQPAVSGSKWELNMRSVEVIPKAMRSETCLQFTAHLDIAQNSALSFGNGFTNINLRFNSEDTGKIIWEQR